MKHITDALKLQFKNIKHSSEFKDYEKAEDDLDLERKRCEIKKNDAFVAVCKKKKSVAKSWDKVWKKFQSTVAKESWYVERIKTQPSYKKTVLEEFIKALY